MATNQNLILWPTLSQKPKSPVIPRSKVDPTMSRKSVSKMERDIEDRYYAIKVALKALFDQRLTGRKREVNSHSWHFLCHDNGEDVRLYQVNAGKFIYDMSAQELADLLESVQVILDDYLLEGGEQNLWAMDYVAAEAQRGTLEAFNNLSQQSQVYASQTTLQQLLSSPAYQNQIASAYISTYSDWKLEADRARGDLANIIADAVGRGVNPRETAQVISKRLDVSMGRAKTIAQTEQVGALRQAQWNETDWAADRLGLNTGLLWLSALKPTTRSWHASRHGKVYTTEQVRDFYAENGNRYNCYCSQIPVLLNDDGSIFNQGLAEKLAKERQQWTAKEAA
ncbi:TPA: phage head morphogenesis protein [Klebsiella pneumoniae]|nr:phage head morphogenesis protein [Klebsiella pneumoniae]EKZ5698974.1 phage head morphogenesis protein [Klebsiella pneumoniae]EKZ6494003.1 phage head morphogenesis protein [Klebsiella pneumoniae]ELA2506377.1 phage head morphogenesis protein [Klebsiella pneumoniae]ELB6556455.1 phage head morphogenesis protein [Klebsiella pneumoniae]